MNRKISGNKLLSLFMHEMNASKDFSFITGCQPFKISFAEKEYFIYIKNISSAYFKDRPDINRAQLPLREEFDFIKQSDIPFVFLGYDAENDVYVCWNYYTTKQRLNVQDNVSFYSRQSWQNHVLENVFLQKNLRNGDKVVLFKRKSVVKFFEQIDIFFGIPIILSENKNSAKMLTTNDKLYKITDVELLRKLTPLLVGGNLHTLEAIQLVQNFYQDKYPCMTYRDWSNLIKTIKL
ncbi:MAG: hypothetical protein K2N31_02925 [Treponemataceae bacterium]|nr:hypothetical protein [Treponemataceae bacterium]